AEALHCHDWAEHLALYDLAVGPGGNHHRVLVPRSLLLQRRAAREDLGAILPGARDETRHALELLVGNERAHLSVGSEPVADLQRADRRHEVAQHAVVDARSRDDARRRGAVLTRVEEAADLDAFD